MVPGPGTAVMRPEEGTPCHADVQGPAAPPVPTRLPVGSASPPSEPHLSTASSYLSRPAVEGPAPAVAFPVHDGAPGDGRTYASAGAGRVPPGQGR